MSQKKVAVTHGAAKPQDASIISALGDDGNIHNPDSLTLALTGENLVPVNDTTIPSIMFRLRRSLPFLGAVLILMIVAASLRLPRAGYGLPYCYGWDEPEIMQPVHQIMRHGDYGLVRSHRIGYGALNTYLHTGWAVKSYLGGAGAGDLANQIWGLQGERETGYYWKIPSSHLWRQARKLSSYMGCLAVLLVFLAGRLMGGLSVGFAAGLFAAVLPVGVGMTTSITPDAPALACTAGVLWCAAHIERDRSPWAYIVGALFAAAAFGFKLNYALGFALLPLAHFAACIRRNEPILDVHFARLVAVFVPLAAITQVDALRFPLQWLTNYGSEMSAHRTAEGVGLGSMILAAIKSVLAFSGAGEFKEWSFNQPDKFELRWSGLPTALVFVVGLVALYRSRSLLHFLLVVAVPGLVVLSIIQNPVYLFTRYILPALPPLALIVGFGTVYSARWIHRKALFPAGLRRFSVPAIIFLTMGPLIINQAAETRTLSQHQDPRVTLEKEMIKSLPKNSKIAVAAELRWAPSTEFESKFQWYPISSLAWLENPQVTSGTDYLVMPHKVGFSSIKEPYNSLEPVLNDLLKQLQAERESFSSANQATPVMFGQPPRSSSVKLVRNTPKLVNRSPFVPTGMIPGWAFQSPALTNGVAYGDGLLGLLNGREVRSFVRITTASKTVTVRGYGTSPLEQPTPPSVNLEVWPTDAATTRPVGKIDVALNRSQARSVDYPAPLALPPGIYQVKLRATDMNARVLMLEGIRFN